MFFCEAAQTIGIFVKSDQSGALDRGLMVVPNRDTPPFSQMVRIKPHQETRITLAIDHTQNKIQRLLL
jgi:hypothetical protein